MKKSIFMFSYASLFLLTSAMALWPSDDFKVTTGHAINFKSADPSGKFTEISGDVSYNPKAPTSTTFDLSIPVNTISTGNGMMNKKAMTDEWFGQGSHPDIKFKSTSVVQDGSSLKITGNLTIKGITKEYTIPATVSGSASKYTFKGTFSVNRIDFKVGKKSETVPDKMKIIYELPVSK